MVKGLTRNNTEKTHDETHRNQMKNRKISERIVREANRGELN